jgi:hypothetical protein
MLRIRHAGTLDPMMTDSLRFGEGVLVFITMLFGGVVIVGSIYYYGWKSRFPRKSKSILYMEWILIALIIISGAYFGYTTYLKQQQDLQQVMQGSTGQQLLPQNPSQSNPQVSAQVQQAETELGAQMGIQSPGTSTSAHSYSNLKENYNIRIPVGYFENKTDEESSQTYSVLSWVTYLATSTLKVQSDDRTGLNSVTGYDETSVLQNASTDATASVSHPAISGAVGQTNFVESSSSATAGNETVTSFYLFVHGNGTNIYEVDGFADGVTSEEVAALKQAILSFSLR